MSFSDQLVAEFESLGTVLAEWLPRILVALLILVIGQFIVKWLRRITMKLLNVGWVDGVFDKAGINKALEPSDQNAAAITATILYAYLMVVLWLIVFRVLQISSIVELLERFLVWVPIVVLAGVVVVIAAAVASWTAALVKPFADANGIPWLGWVVHIGIIVFGVLFALDLLGISFAADVTLILSGSIGIALAISFGVGGIDAAKLWWKKYGSPKDRSPM